MESAIKTHVADCNISLSAILFTWQNHNMPSTFMWQSLTLPSIIFVIVCMYTLPNQYFLAEYWNIYVSYTLPTVFLWHSIDYAIDKIWQSLYFQLCHFIYMAESCSMTHLFFGRVLEYLFCHIYFLAESCMEMGLHTGTSGVGWIHFADLNYPLKIDFRAFKNSYKM